jgi:hypothetical protein
MWVKSNIVNIKRTFGFVKFPEKAKVWHGEVLLRSMDST